MKVFAILAVFVAFAAALPTEVPQPQTDQQDTLLSADASPQQENAERSKRFIFFKKLFIPFPIFVSKQYVAPVAFAAPAPVPVVTPIVQRTVVQAPIPVVQKTIVAAPVIHKTISFAPAPVVYAAAPVIHKTVVAAPVVHKTVVAAPAPVAYAAPAAISASVHIPSISVTKTVY